MAAASGPSSAFIVFMAAASGPSLVLGLGMMSLLMMVALPKAAVSYAEVGFAVEKSALRPMPRRVGASGVEPKAVLPMFENGGRTPSKKALALRSASSAAASAGVSM